MDEQNNSQNGAPNPYAGVNAAGADASAGTGAGAVQPTQPQQVNPYGSPVQPTEPVAEQSVNPSANPYAAVQQTQPASQAVSWQAQPTQDGAAAGQANPYAAAQQAQPQGANPYAAQGDPTQPAAWSAQPANPYGQPVDPYGQSANPYGAASGQQPASSPYQAGAGAAGGVPPYGQQPYGQSPSPYPGGAPMVGTGKATGALVCGILAILFSSSVIVSIILGIAAIVLAGSYLKEGGTAGTAKAGRICGVVGIVFSVICLVFYLVVGVAVFDEMQNDFDFDSPAISSSSGSFSITSDEVLDADERAARDVVVAELDKLKNADPAAVASIAAIAEQGFSSATDGLTMAECGIDSAEYARLMLGGFDYELNIVLADSADGDGFVSATVTCRDVFDVLDEFNDKMTEFQNSAELNNMSVQQAQERMGLLFMESARDADMEDDGYFSVDVLYQNGSWVIDQDSWNEELDYFFGVY